MAYYVEVADREDLPSGRDWMFLEHTNGDVRLVVARDAEPFVLSKESIQAIAEALARGDYLTSQMLGEQAS